MLNHCILINIFKKTGILLTTLTWNPKITVQTLQGHNFSCLFNLNNIHVCTLYTHVHLHHNNIYSYDDK